MMSRAQSRTVLSCLIVMALLFGLVIAPVGSHSATDYCAPVASLFSPFIPAAASVARSECRAPAQSFDSFHPAAPDRAPPLNRTAVSIV
jgi:hypothetical protein